MAEKKYKEIYSYRSGETPLFQETDITGLVKIKPICTESPYTPLDARMVMRSKEDALKSLKPAYRYPGLKIYLTNEQKEYWFKIPSFAIRDQENNEDDGDYNEVVAEARDQYIGKEIKKDSAFIPYNPTNHWTVIDSTTYFTDNHITIESGMEVNYITTGTNGKQTLKKVIYLKDENGTLVEYEMASTDYVDTSLSTSLENYYTKSDINNTLGLYSTTEETNNTITTALAGSYTRTEADSVFLTQTDAENTYATTAYVDAKVANKSSDDSGDFVPYPTRANAVEFDMDDVNKEDGSLLVEINKNTPYIFITGVHQITAEEPVAGTVNDDGPINPKLCFDTTKLDANTLKMAQIEVLISESTNIQFGEDVCWVGDAADISTKTSFYMLVFRFIYMGAEKGWKVLGNVQAIITNF